MDAIGHILGALRTVSLSLFFVLLANTFGCKAANCDLVEAELRSKERQLEELKEELHKCGKEVELLESEVEQIRHTHKPGTTPVASGTAVKSITLGRRTGGYDSDFSLPGDEALQVLLEPRDPDNHAIKAPGAVHIDLYEVTTEGMKTPLSSWDIDPRTLRQTWEVALIGTPAYRLTLPWKERPVTDKLRVVVYFTTADGRKFEADKDFTIRLPERPAQRKRNPVKPAEQEPAPAPPPMDPVPPAAPAEAPPSGPSLDQVDSRDSFRAAQPLANANMAPVLPGPPPPAAAAGEVNAASYTASPPPAAPASPQRGVSIRPPVNAR